MQQGNSEISLVGGNKLAETHNPYSKWLRQIGPTAFTSLDMAKLDDRKLFVQANGNVAEEAEHFINTELAVKHLLFHQVEEMNPDTGEMKYWQRQVVILSDGKMIGFGSKGIHKSLALAAIMFGPPPWPGLRGKLKQIPLDETRRTYEIEWDLEQQLCPADESTPPTGGPKKPSATRSPK